MKLAIFYLEKVNGVEWYPLIAMGIFFIFFLLIGIWVIRLKKNYIHKMSHAPLHDDIPE